MSSDSSEEENIELLREAVDQDFNSRLFEPNCKKGPARVNWSSSKPSLRHQHEEEEPSLNVTPESQMFIAKQLMKKLDSQIKEVNGPVRCRDSGAQGGIHLFAASTTFLSCEEAIDSTARQSRKAKLKKSCKKHSEGISEEEKCRKAAVSAEWVLSQEAVSGWEPNTKGKLEILSGDEVEIIRNENLTNFVLTLKEKEDKKRLKRDNSQKKLKLKKFEENAEDANKESA